jgi:outer membrane protein OmpA-like peptidoglycan-associated protein
MKSLIFASKIKMKHFRIASLLILGLLTLQSFAQTQPVKPKKPAGNEQKEISPAVQIYFETNKSVIKPAELLKLKQLLDTLDSKDEYRLILTGHTDSSGNDDLNLKLSQARVDNVYQFLIDNDIETDWMNRQYFGRAKPREKVETSEEKKAKNRRVEITILEKPKPVEKPKPKPVFKDTCTALRVFRAGKYTVF